MHSTYNGRVIQVIVTDTDSNVDGWADISVHGRHWRVPTGPGYPANPNVPPNEYLSAPQVCLLCSWIICLNFLT